MHEEHRHVMAVIKTNMNENVCRFYVLPKSNQHKNEGILTKAIVV